MPVSAPAFSRGLPETSSGGVFEPALLPDAQKEELCRSLLSEFGVTNIRAREPDGELIHGCLIDPTHQDQARNPTGSLNYKKLTYKCLGCGSQGGLLWFIGTLRGVSATEARKWLAQATGLDGQVMDLSDLLRYFDALYDTSRGKAAPIPKFSERMLAPWNLIHPYLTDPIEEQGRGIPEQTVIDLRMGYAEAYKVGERADKTPITSERIVIPHFWKGNLVGWQTRRLDSRDGTAKYLSSPDFPKDTTLYNYDAKRERVIVVEAMLSVAAHFHALPEMTATFGASVTPAQRKLLTKFPTVVLFMDNDRAGWEAVEGKREWVRWNDGSLHEKVHSVGMAEELGRYCNVLVVENPWAADPADLPTEEVQRLISEAVPFGVWKRPEVLYCWTCKQIAHEGPCREVM